MNAAMLARWQDVARLADQALDLEAAHRPDFLERTCAGDTTLRAEVERLLAASELAAGRKPRIHDTWIAATALVHGAELWTQDSDFTAFTAVDVVRV